MENEQKMKYLLICSHCGNKCHTDGGGRSRGDFVEVKTAPLPSRANGSDKTFKPLPKKFKCGQCGYIFKIVRLQEEPAVEPEKNDFEIP